MKKLICYEERLKNNNIKCCRENCEHWIDENNCVAVLHKKKSSIAEIASAFNTTRVRISNLETMFTQAVLANAK